MKNASENPFPEIRCVAVDLIRPLRMAVLRPGLPAEAARFDGDAVQTTLHLAACCAELVVGCASFMQSRFKEEPAYQLRGMATDPAWRGVGVGRRLLEHGGLLLRDQPIRLLWCNARTTAVGFYVKQGWKVVSAEFDIPTAGMHVHMIKRV